MGIATGIDKLLELVHDKKRVTIKEAAKKLGIEEEKVESWGRTLSDEDIMELIYPANPLEPPFLQVVGYKPKKTKRKKKKEKKQKEKAKPTEKPKTRKLPSKAFLSRFKKTSRKDFKTYREKVEKSKEKKKHNIRNQLVLMILVVIVIVFLMIYFGVLPNPLEGLL